MRAWPVLVCFSLSAGLRLRVAAGDGQQAALEVDVAPAQRGDLASARAGEHGQPEQQAPLRVAPRRVQQPRGLVGAGRVGLGALGRRGDGHRGLVHAEVAPADGAFEGAADDVVHLARGAGAQRPAGVAGAGAAGAHVAAAVQAGVEALQQLGVELGGLEVPERRQDVEPDQVLRSARGWCPPARRPRATARSPARTVMSDFGCWSSSTWRWSLVSAFLAAVVGLARSRGGSAACRSAGRCRRRRWRGTSRWAAARCGPRVRRFRGGMGRDVARLVPRIVHAPKRVAIVERRNRWSAGGAPGRIRTCATASGGRCSIP